MSADRERAEALRQEWRQRLNSILGDLLPSEERLAEYDRDVTHERVTDKLATYDPPPKEPRSWRSRLYGWNKHMRGR